MFNKQKQSKSSNVGSEVFDSSAKITSQTPVAMQTPSANQASNSLQGARKMSNANANNIRKQSKLYSQQDELALRVMQKYGLERVDLEMINFNFKKFDSTDSGKVQFFHLLQILKNLQFTVDENLKKSIFKELEDRALKQIDMETVCLIVGVLRQKEQKRIEEGDEDSQSEFIDAFVALGGNPDGTGRVLKQSMLKIIKEEFDLTFDMEKIMERIEASSEELDYPTFCMLFDNQEENRNRRNSRTSTMLSQISSRSRKSAKSVASVKIRYQDFEKFCQENNEE